MSGLVSRFQSIIGEAPSEGEPEAAVDISIDEALDVLSNRRRRLVIRFIHAQGDGEFDLNQLVRYISTEEYGLEFDSKQRKRVYVSMYQSHMEQLVAANVVQPSFGGAGHQYRPDVAAEPLYKLLTTAEDVLEVSD